MSLVRCSIQTTPSPYLLQPLFFYISLKSRSKSYGLIQEVEYLQEPTSLNTESYLRRRPIWRLLASALSSL